MEDHDIQFQDAMKTNI